MMWQPSPVFTFHRKSSEWSSVVYMACMHALQRWGSILLCEKRRPPFVDLPVLFCGKCHRAPWCCAVTTGPAVGHWALRPPSWSLLWSETFTPAGGVVGLWQCSSCASILVRVAPVSWNFLKGLDNVLEDTANLLKMACTDMPSMEYLCNLCRVLVAVVALTLAKCKSTYHHL